MNDEEILKHFKKFDEDDELHYCIADVGTLMALARADEREKCDNEKFLDLLKRKQKEKGMTSFIPRDGEEAMMMYEEAFERGKLQGREDERDKMVLQECPKCKTRITNNKAFDRVSELEKQVAELNAVIVRNLEIVGDKTEENAKLRELIRDFYKHNLCPDKKKCKDKLCLRIRKALEGK